MPGEREEMHGASGQRQDDTGGEERRKGLLITKSEHRKSTTDSTTVSLSRVPPFIKIRSSRETEYDLTKEHESKEERDRAPRGHTTKRKKRRTSEESITYDSGSRSLTFSNTDTNVTKVTRNRETPKEE